MKKEASLGPSSAERGLPVLRTESPTDTPEASSHTCQVDGQNGSHGDSQNGSHGDSQDGSHSDSPGPKVADSQKRGSNEMTQ